VTIFTTAERPSAGERIMRPRDRYRTSQEKLQP